jgi:hypothetical protein
VFSLTGQKEDDPWMGGQWRKTPRWEAGELFPRGHKVAMHLNKNKE